MTQSLSDSLNRTHKIYAFAVLQNLNISQIATKKLSWTGTNVRVTNRSAGRSFAFQPSATWCSTATG